MAETLEYTYEYVSPTDGWPEWASFRRIYKDKRRSADYVDIHGNLITSKPRKAPKPRQLVEGERRLEMEKYQHKDRIVEETRKELSAQLPLEYVDGNWSVRVSMGPEMRKIHQKTLPHPKESYVEKKRFEAAEMKNYREIMRKTCETFGIPLNVFAQLLTKENRTMNPLAKNPYSSAFGIWQMLIDTWRSMERRLYDQGITHHRYLDRENPTNQILLAGAYLEYVREKVGCSWAEAMVYYHTGPSLSRFNLSKALVSNPAIARRMPEGRKTKQDYVRVAAQYYNTARFWISPNEMRV